MERKNKTDATPYEMVFFNDNSNDDKPLAKVIGHDTQKEEIILLLDWFKNKDYWNSKKVTLPKGILLHGEPGNGKSLLIREVIKYSHLPTFIFKGDVDNINKGLEATFKKSKEAGHSIVVIDELDLLIDKDSRVTRTLQENLDGVESSDDILVIAATNNIWDIPCALLRNGRLEKVIEIPYPTGQEAVDLLKMHFKEFNATLLEGFDEKELCLTLDSISCAGVRTIANDVVLRNGFENITEQMVLDSIYRATNSVKGKNKAEVYATAVHEAGHAIMANYYSNFFEITRLDINQGSGKLSVKEKIEDYWPYDKVVADIKVSCAGVIAQKIICGVGSLGCESDLQRARQDAWNVINKSGLISCSDALPEIKPYSNVREESENKRNSNVKKADKLLKKCEREATRYLKKNQQKIIKVADELFKKKFLRSKEVLSIINA